MKLAIKIFILLFSSYMFGQQTLLEQSEKFLYTNKDSAYYFLNLLYHKSVHQKDWVKAIEALSYSNITSSYFGDYTTFSKTLQREDSIFNLKINIETLKDGLYYKHYYWYDKGSYNYVLHNYKKSSTYFFKLLNSLEKLPDSIIAKDYASFMTSANSFLATMYGSEFKYELAQEFLEENLRLHQKFNDPINEVLATNDLLAALKVKQKEYNASNHYIKKSLKYYFKHVGPNENASSLLSATGLLVNNYVHLKLYDSAFYYIDKAKPYLKENNNFKSYFLQAVATIYKDKKAYDKALKTYKTLLNTNTTGDKLALVYKDIGDIYFIQKNYTKAYLNYQKGLQFFKNKEVQHQLESANSTTNILQFYNAISNVLFKLKNENNYKKINKIGYKTITKLNALKKTYTNDIDKQKLVENTLPIFENAIEANYQQFLQSKNNNYLDTAFVFFEKSKSTILLDALQKNNAEKYADLPSKLLDKEKLFKRNISIISKKVQNGLKDKKVLFQLKREYERFIRNLEKEYPKYHQLKYNNQIVSLKEAQDQLDKKELLISYFYGDQSIYLIAITNKTKALYKIKRSTKEQFIYKFQRLLANPKSNLLTLMQTSNKVYNTYVKSALKGKETFEKIIFMPDGPLRNIPFESLSTTPSTLNYLINTKTISYANSATFLSHLHFSPNKNPQVLAFAPNFNMHIKGVQKFSKLPNNQQEINNINNYFEGKYLIGIEASLQNFQKNLEHFKIIHLATHAETNDKYPEYSFLAFSPTKTNPFKIYVNDLYALNINSDLVTLSACKTGVGNLKKGEGMLSLSRAFFYAGAKSLVYTLWNINDNSSAIIMDGFYQNLSEGIPKNVALRNAKLSFLEKNKETGLVHPYYWAGFIISGNTLPVVPSFNFIWYVLAIFLLLILLLRKLR